MGGEHVMGECLLGSGLAAYGLREGLSPDVLWGLNGSEGDRGE